MRLVSSFSAQDFRGIDLKNFERVADSLGIRLLATPINDGNCEIDVSICAIGNAVLTSFRFSDSVGLCWLGRPASIGIILTLGQNRLSLEGQTQAPPSVILVVDPRGGNWAGIMSRSREEPEATVRRSYFISLPIETALMLGLEGQRGERAWQETAISSVAAREFASWADEVLCSDESSPSPRQEELYQRLKRLTTVPFGEQAFSSPSHYAHIIHRVLTQADAALPHAIPIGDLAGRLGLSSRTIQRAFKVTFGVGVSHFLRNRRLQRAHELLKEEGMTVGRAAFASGFRHIPRFAQQYRRLFGCSPSDTLES